MSKTDKKIQEYVLDKVIKERDHQDRKFSDEELFADSHLWLRVLVEEVGEVANAMVASTETIEDELVQVAAVAVGWLEDIEHEKAREEEYGRLWDERHKSST